MPNLFAAARVSSRKGRYAKAGLCSTPTLVSRGTASLSSSRSLRRQLRRVVSQTGHVPAGTAEAGHEASANGVAARKHDNGDAAGRLTGRSGGWVIQGDDDVHLGLQELSRGLGQGVVTTLCRTTDNHQVSAFHVAEFPKCLEIRAVWRGAIRPCQDSNAVHLCRRLCLDDERRGEHASKASDEGAAVHGGRMVAPDELAEQGRCLRERAARPVLRDVATARVTDFGDGFQDRSHRRSRSAARGHCRASSQRLVTHIA
jgi:hypothetical protein